MSDAYPAWPSIAARMATAGLPDALTKSFERNYRRYRDGASGKVPWDAVSPPVDGDIIPFAATRSDADATRGRALLDKLVCIRLNGGLGTTMALSRAKSLIRVRDDQSFLEIAAAQVDGLRERYGAHVPLLLMNSFRTRDDSLALLGARDQPDGLPLDFLQNKVPRIVDATGAALALDDDAANWAPPGHGDIYLALQLSGILDQLADAGYRWAFVSNVDNLGATVDPGLLGHLDRQGVQLAMEVTRKSAADKKGGTLVRRDGRLTLLERAQVEAEHLCHFEDIDTLEVFNTNTLWWRIDAVRAALASDPGLDLPMIVNRKTVADVDVVQLETAMGAAVGCFERAVGVEVPRTRFAPVKATCDLLGTRSDAYLVDDEGGLRPHPDRDPAWGPPVITLDDRYFKALSDFEARCPHPLGLRRCRSLTVEGDVTFGRKVTVVGDAIVVAQRGSLRIEDGTQLTGRFEL